MEHTDTTEPQPPIPSAFERLHLFMSRMQQMIDRHVRELNRPLSTLTDEEFAAFLNKLNAYVAFELETEEVPSNIPLCISGTGLFILQDQHGHDNGSQSMVRGDLLFGNINGVLVRDVPTLQAKAAAEALEPIGDKTDFLMSLTITMNDAIFCTDADNKGNFTHEHDLSGLTIQVPRVYPLRFASVELITQQ